MKIRWIERQKKVVCLCIKVTIQWQRWADGTEGWYRWWTVEVPTNTDYISSASALLRKTDGMPLTQQKLFIYNKVCETYRSPGSCWLQAADLAQLGCSQLPIEQTITAVRQYCSCQQWSSNIDINSNSQPVQHYFTQPLNDDTDIEYQISLTLTIVVSAVNPIQYFLLLAVKAKRFLASLARL